MTDTKPSGTLINLALIPFALIGMLILGTCGVCTAALLSEGFTEGYDRKMQELNP